MCTLLFHILINKKHFTSILGSEGNMIYNCQALQQRNNGFGKVGDCQSLQNIIIIILYNVYILHDICTLTEIML
jgi:hypothetical protein